MRSQILLLERRRIVATFRNVSAEGPLILAGEGYHTGREIGKCAEQSHDGLGSEPAKETARSPLKSYFLEYRGPASTKVRYAKVDHYYNCLIYKHAVS